ncbi:MAG: hypothetical protein V4525_17340 [Pseudomonadota bacterium]
MKKFIKNIMILNFLLLIVGIAGGFFFESSRQWLGIIFYPLIILLLIQIVAGVIGIFTPNVRLISLFAMVHGLVELFCMVFLAMGAGWGRPLRIRGRQIHPDLREGTDWTRGPRPDPTNLDEPTRQALEALWLHDAQKEHASVPAFSRISWMLAAIGAPAELMEWAHRAALEEIEHTRLCFAIAAGYAGRSHTVEPMPDLLIGGLDTKADPLHTLATESLSDGCQLEDFNADVAEACALICEEPATRTVLLQIASEERSHAEFSWALLTWLLERYPEKIKQAVEKTAIELENYRRPTAVGWDKKHLVAQADPIQLLKHGRLPDERWKELWDKRLTQTQQRLKELLEN